MMLRLRTEYYLIKTEDEIYLIKDTFAKVKQSDFIAINLLVKGANQTTRMFNIS
jgi:hypothetical protein